MKCQITCSIVLYCQKAELVRPLLASLLECGLIQVIFLVDNSPTNVLKAIATNDRIKYIFNNANVGYGAAHNIAISKILAHGNYHIVLNPDVAFEAGTIENIYNYMVRHPETGLLMPKIKYPNGNLQYACNLLPAPADLLARRFLPKVLKRKRMQRFEMRESGYNSIMEVPYLSGCFMFLRVEALRKTGMFDERFFLYPEDIDLTRRIHKHYKTIFFPFAEIQHIHQRASRRSIKLFFIHLVNMVRYFNKWGWFFDRERDIINTKTLRQFAH